uniref:Uncharacterized protein n=1 Tax=Zea mays TaxID=4577 RepID=A0A804MIJ2_MAIZE
MAMKHVIICCLLLALMLQSDQTSAADICSYADFRAMFCKNWMCKSQCWFQSQLITPPNVVKEHRCIKGGIYGLCHCVFCKK